MAWVQNEYGNSMIWVPDPPVPGGLIQGLSPAAPQGQPAGPPAPAQGPSPMVAAPAPQQTQMPANDVHQTIQIAQAQQQAQQAPPGGGQSSGDLFAWLMQQNPDALTHEQRVQRQDLGQQWAHGGFPAGQVAQAQTQAAPQAPAGAGGYDPRTEELRRLIAEQQGITGGEGETVAAQHQASLLQMLLENRLSSPFGPSSTMSTAPHYATGGSEFDMSGGGYPTTLPPGAVPAGNFGAFDPKTGTMYGERPDLGFVNQLGDVREMSPEYQNLMFQAWGLAQGGKPLQPTVPGLTPDNRFGYFPKGGYPDRTLDQRGIENWYNTVPWERGRTNAPDPQGIDTDAYIIPALTALLTGGAAGMAFGGGVAGGAAGGAVGGGMAGFAPTGGGGKPWYDPLVGAATGAATGAAGGYLWGGSPGTPGLAEGLTPPPADLPESFGGQPFMGDVPPPPVTGYPVGQTGSTPVDWPPPGPTGPDRVFPPTADLPADLPYINQTMGPTGAEGLIDPKLGERLPIRDLVDQLQAQQEALAMGERVPPMDNLNPPSDFMPPQDTPQSNNPGVWDWIKNQDLKTLAGVGLLGTGLIGGLTGGPGGAGTPPTPPTFEPFTPGGTGGGEGGGGEEGGGEEFHDFSGTQPDVAGALNAAKDVVAALFPNFYDTQTQFNGLVAEVLKELRGMPMPDEASLTAKMTDLIAAQEEEMNQDIAESTDKIREAANRLGENPAARLAQLDKIEVLGKKQIRANARTQALALIQAQQAALLGRVTPMLSLLQLLDPTRQAGIAAGVYGNILGSFTGLQQAGMGLQGQLAQQANDLSFKTDLANFDMQNQIKLAGYNQQLATYQQDQASKAAQKQSLLNALFGIGGQLIAPKVSLASLLGG